MSFTPFHYMHQRGVCWHFDGQGLPCVLPTKGRYCDYHQRFYPDDESSPFAPAVRLARSVLRRTERADSSPGGVNDD